MYETMWWVLVDPLRLDDEGFEEKEKMSRGEHEDK